MKTCFKCGQTKEVSSFATKIKSSDGLQPQCRECQRLYRRKHYEANREKYISKARSWAKTNTQVNYQELAAYFETHPCVDCGEADMEVLEFDHRDPSLKDYTIGRRIYDKTWDQLLLEIQKCDVRCANCHRRKTNRQFGFWRTASPPTEAPGSTPE